MFIKKIAEKEIKDNEFLLSSLEEGIVRERCKSSLEWYSAHAVKHKMYFYILSIITICCPVIADVILLISIDEAILKPVTGIVMGISAIAAALLTLFDSRNKWGQYRSQAEFMKKTLALYGASEKFEDKDLCNLLEKLEESMDKSQYEWFQKLMESK